VARIPPALKVRGRQPKRLLQEVARPLLPESVRARRDKSPFPIPVGQWFAGALSGTVQRILRSPRCLDRGIFDPDRLRESAFPPMLAWQVLNLELWFRIFVDCDPHWVAQTARGSTASTLRPLDDLLASSG